MAMEDRLLDAMRHLPPDRQQTLVDFAEFLAGRSVERPASWPAEFLATYGGWKGELTRESEGDYEVREQME